MYTHELHEKEERDRAREERYQASKAAQQEGEEWQAKAKEDPWAEPASWSGSWDNNEQAWPQEEKHGPCIPALDMNATDKPQPEPPAAARPPQPEIKDQDKASSELGAMS